MPTTITILTPENVEVTYELAGLATRMRAAALDTLLQLMGIMGVWVAMAVLTAGVERLVNWWIALGTLLTFAIFVGYFLYFESRWNGQTPGKRVVGARVLK